MTDTARLRDLEIEIESAGDPEGRLLDLMLALERQQLPATLTALFETRARKLRAPNYWILAVAAQAYERLAKDEAAAAIASLAIAANPQGVANPRLYDIVFKHFLKSGMRREAACVFVDALRAFPASPIADASFADPLLSETGVVLPLRAVSPRGALDRTQRIVVAASRLEAKPDIPVLGDSIPYTIENMRFPRDRPAIQVATLTSAEVVVYDNSVVVLGSDGLIQRDLSTAAYPDAVLDRVERLEAEGRLAPSLEAACAVIITDPWPAPNYCHFLLDQIARLALYEMAGEDVSAAAVIGPEVRHQFQRDLIAAAGVREYIGIGANRRIRVERLLVSSECARPLHHAYQGAAWPMQWLRRKFTAPAADGGQASGALKLWVSRSDGGQRHVVNESDILPILERRGFQKVVPGELTVRQQAELFSRASHVAGPHGAGLSNLAFVPPGTHVLEIFHPLFSNPAYVQLADALELRYTALVGRDWESDDPQFNDPAAAVARDKVTAWHYRSIRAPIELLERWMDGARG